MASTALAAARATTDARSVLTRRVVQMYRQMCRDVPKVLVMYGLEQTVAEARHMLLLHFRKNAAVTDPRIVELMLARAQMEVEETMQQWKQKPHLMAILQPEAKMPDAWLDADEMMKRFLSGTLTESTVWAGWDARKLDERTAKVRARVLEDSERDVAAGISTGEEAKEYLRVQRLLQQLAAPLR